MLRYVLCFPKWLVICMVLSIVLSFPVGQDVIFMGIPPADIAGEIDLIQVGKWVALCCIPLLANGVILEHSKQIELFSLLRVKRRLSLRLQEVYACIICTIAWAVAIFCVAAWQLGNDKAVKIIILLLPNLMMWSGVGLVCYALSKRAAWSADIALTLLGGSCLIGTRFPTWMPYLPCAWGMLSQTVAYGTLGSTPFMSVASSLSAAVCYLIFIIFEEN